MSLSLWIGQVLLALAFVGVGYNHAFGFDQGSTRPGMTWMAAVGRGRMRIIGILEILGAIGLILPAATGILPWLTPVAAAALATLMVFAAIFHLRRPGESRSIVLNLVLGAIALAIAYGRFVIEPL
jgi:uncharacterized membrane protein